MGRAAALTGCAVVAACAVLACSVEHRPQLVVTVTTDLALPSQIESDADLSASASIDRVRVDVLGPGGDLRDTHGFVVRDLVNFPLTFGVAEVNAGEQLDVHVVGYRASWTATTGAGPAPSPGVSVDRLVRTGVAGVETMEIVLRGDCIGRAADLTAGMTCIDAQSLDAAATTPVGSTSDAAPGQWGPARARPCTATTPEGMKCIAGGVSSIGDPELVQVDATSDLVPSPPRTVAVSPFFLDEEEMTVARLRSLAATLPALPTLESADARCNYTTSAGATDAQAVRCVSFATAQAACAATGAMLPTEAQWEHAARGRGLGTRYPWGDATPTCCTAALGGGALGCSPTLTTGAYADPSKCDGTADVSIDGVLDLGGGVREWVLDSPQSFNDCIPAGVASDPVCGDAAASGSVKGGSYVTPLEWASSALRRTGASPFDVGFRCARKGE